MKERFDGFIKDIPYIINEFDGDNVFSIADETLKKIRNIGHPIDKLVYMFLDSFSCGYDIPIIFVYIGLEEIAYNLGVDIFDVEASIDRLVYLGKIKVLEREGFANSYATLK